MDGHDSDEPGAEDSNVTQEAFAALVRSGQAAVNVLWDMQVTAMRSYWSDGDLTMAAPDWERLPPQTRIDVASEVLGLIGDRVHDVHRRVVGY